MSLETDEDSVFLLQLPSYVVDRWRQARGTTLGRLTISNEESPSVKLRLHGEYARDLPKDYVGTISEGQSKVFNISEQGISVSGPLLQMKTRVERTLNPKTGQLELDANVSRLAKEKNNQERKKAKMKTTQEISLSAGHDKRHALLSTAMQKRRKADLQRESERKLKRARKDKGALETELFSLFEDKKHWTIASLQKRTDQPLVWLREVLNDIAVLNRSGPHAGSYELKPEFSQD